MRKQLSSEFGAVDVSIGEGSTKDIKPFMHSDEAKAIQDITGAREAGLGTIPTEGTFAGSTPLDAMSGMETTFNRDWFAEQGENLSSDLFTGGGEGGAEPVVPSTFWSTELSKGLGDPSNMGGLVNQFLGKVNTASNVWADANQSLLEAQQAIGSKEREIGDLERSKGESAVETRAGLLGNVLDEEKRQYESGLAGMGSTPGEQLGIKSLLDKGAINLRGINEGILAEGDALEGLHMQEAHERGQRELAAAGLKNPYQHFQQAMAQAKSDYGPDWQREEGSLFTNLMGALGGGL